MADRTPRSQCGTANVCTWTLARPSAVIFDINQSRARASGGVAARRGPISVVSPATIA